MIALCYAAAALALFPLHSNGPLLQEQSTEPDGWPRRGRRVHADPDRCIERPTTTSIERAAPCLRAPRMRGLGWGAHDLMGFCCWARPGACTDCAGYNCCWSSSKLASSSVGDGKKTYDYWRWLGSLCLDLHPFPINIF